MRKVINFLFIVLLVSMNSVYADTPTTPASKNLVESESIKLKEELNLSGLEHYITVNRQKKLLNYYIYFDPFYRGKIIYGNPQEIENIPKYSEDTKRKEYRYLGWNKDGNPVTNPFYPNDIINGLKPNQWNVTTGYYVSRVKAFKSWDNVNSISNVIYEYNREAPLEGNGLNYIDNWSARDFDGGNDSNIKVEILTVAGLYTSGTIKVEHTDSGVKYGTFNTRIIPNQRNEKLKVNGTAVTQITIDDDISTEESPVHNGYSVNLDGVKDEIELQIDISSLLTSTEPLYSPGIIEKYNLKLSSYSINKGQVQSIGASSIHNGNSGSQLNYTLKLNRSDLTVGANYIRLQWESEIKTIVEKPFIRHYESMIAVNVEESNKPPKAIIQAPSQVYVGDIVDIKGLGEDTETSPEKLTYKWSGDIENLSEIYPTVGGSHEFNEEGTFKISLTVIDEKMATNTVEKVITVKARDKALINLDASIDPTSYIYTENNPNVNLKIDTKGNVIDKKNKEIKKLEITVSELQKDFKIGDISRATSTQIVESTSENVQDIFTFNVNTQGQEYTQFFEVIFKAEFTDGTSEIESKFLSSKLSKKATVKPMAGVFAMPNPVLAGEETTIGGHASDSDGIIVQEFVDIKGNGDVVFVQNLTQMKKIWVKWDKEKDKDKTEKSYNIWYAAIDDDGELAFSEDYLKVLPPTIEADFVVRGTLKENRKITLDGTITRMPKHYQPTVIRWEISAYDDQADVSSIKYDGELNELEKEMLIKKAGKYKIKLYLENEAGFTDEITKIIEVKPDLPPVAKLTMPETFRGDPNDDNYAKATATDMSKSPDGDEIVRRIWFFAFDSDNDDDPYDETWFVHSDGEWKQISEYGILSANDLEKIDRNKLSYDNNESVTMRVQAVGGYYVALWVFEDFGEPTIEKFIVDGDRKNDNNFDD